MVDCKTAITLIGRAESQDEPRFSLLRSIDRTWAGGRIALSCTSSDECNCCVSEWAIALAGFGSTKVEWGRSITRSL